MNLRFVKGVGPQKLKLLNKIGISNLTDLLFHFPRHYEDRVEDEVYSFVDGSQVTISGIILSSQNIKTKTGKTITKAAIQYPNGIFYATWFNQGFLQKRLSQGKKIIITGKVNRSFGKIDIGVTDFQFADYNDLIHTGRIVPVYSTTENLTAKNLRQIIKNALDLYANEVKELLPARIIKKYDLLAIAEALKLIHFPENIEDAKRARKRFAFEELFLLQLGLVKMKLDQEIEEDGIQHKPDATKVRNFVKGLPYRLTKAQLKVLEDINRDMISRRPMNRLIQGDVGSGKTIVAVISLVLAVSGRYQGALMAPTEILAEQHYFNIKDLLHSLGFRVSLLTGSVTSRERQKVLEGIKNGEIDILVGTHALIQENVEFKSLGLAIIDEQHRFGVKQRAQLKDKGLKADVLVMTATPIPRTLAMTLYGDLDISIIDELPPGRKPIKTFWISEKKLADLYSFIANNLQAGRQAYIVCPLVEESEKIDLESATALAKELHDGVFSQFKVGLVHGKLKSSEKEKIMDEFRHGAIDILVSTTVIEVGVNVPNASIMVIKDAERFGLAQLHQLRGRVGRGNWQSYCILVAEPRTEEGKRRMKVMEETNDGFVIAEEDLKLRGPGEFFGTRQSGLPDLKVADLVRDISLLELARREAVETLSLDPKLAHPENQKLKRGLLEKFKEKLAYINIS